MSDGSRIEENGQVLHLDAGSDTAFQDLMDFLVSQADDEAPGEGGASAEAPAAGDGSPAPANEGTPAAGEAAGAPAAGDGGGEAVPGDGAAAGAGTESGGDAGASAPVADHGWTRDASEFESNWGEVATALEKRQDEELEQAAIAEVRTDYAKYFEAIAKHPRTLVGMEVPRADGKEGYERLNDSNDARDWQEAVKQHLWAEVQDRVSRKRDEVKPMLETLHQSIGVFQKNPDLVPGAKQFDKELADRVAALMKPYELRVDGVLTGWNIPVQPLIEQVRSQLAAERAKAAPAAPAADPVASPTPQQQRAAEQPRNAQGQWSATDAPQAGILSQAGSSGGDAEDFSSLWGTLGLPNLKL